MKSFYQVGDFNISILDTTTPVQIDSVVVSVHFFSIQKGIIFSRKWGKDDLLIDFDESSGLFSGE